jgi:hypothetical protein
MHVSNDIHHPSKQGRVGVGAKRREIDDLQVFGKNR